MPDDSFAAAALPRFLALNPGTERALARLDRIVLAAMLRDWLNTEQARRAILLAAIARLLAAAAEGGD
jgi:hypothetical protein